MTHDCDEPDGAVGDREILTHTYIMLHVRTGSSVQTKFMHDPISLLSMRCAACIEHQSFAHADQAVLCAVNRFVASSCLPKACSCGTVGSVPSRVFSVLVAEEVPIRLLHARRVFPHLAQF